LRGWGQGEVPPLGLGTIIRGRVYVLESLERCCFLLVVYSWPAKTSHLSMAARCAARTRLAQVFQQRVGRRLNKQKITLTSPGPPCCRRRLPRPQRPHYYNPLRRRRRRRRRRQQQQRRRQRSQRRRPRRLLLPGSGGRCLLDRFPSYRCQSCCRQCSAPRQPRSSLLSQSRQLPRPALQLPAETPAPFRRAFVSSPCLSGAACRGPWCPPPSPFSPCSVKLGCLR